MGRTARDTPKLFRVILPVTDIERAASFYAKLLGMPGVRVTSGRHYFDCDGTVLVCFDPRADTDDFDLGPNPDHIYFAVRNLEAAHRKATDLGAEDLSPIETQPWGERSFYAKDPFGNKFCFVERSTMYLGKEPLGIPR